MIKKEILTQIPFNESLSQYGHEDTLFGYDLSKYNIAIHHIDNPVMHVGLDETESFLSKSEIAIQNLAQLIQAGLISESFAKSNISIYRFYLKLKKYRGLVLFKKMYQLFENRINQNIRSTYPNLRYFDFFRLNSFIDQFKS